ncbi:MAG TPA: adenylate/guanylate cyclase domain-containing protein [Myxococcales bacterium]|nr:adenylate/guanylate cyclase domain-containing protein [Myxococcales bacterium]
MSVCAVCYRDNEPVAGRCPSCGAPRAEAARPLSADGAPTQGTQPRAERAQGAHAGPRLVLKGTADPAVYPLVETNVLGRSTTASVKLADREVSRKHSQVDREGGEFVLRDLGSSNGTFLNGKRIFGPMKLKDGDEVMIGTSKMEFRLTNGPVRARNAEIVHTGHTGELEGVVARSVAKATFAPVEQIQDTAQLERDYERLRIGHEFSNYVRLERDLNELLGRILQIAFDLIPCDNGVILIADPHSHELVIQAMRQRRPGEGKVLVSDTLLAAVQARKEGVLTSDAIADERFAASHSIIAAGVRSAMAVPLLSSSGDAVKGVMFLDSRERIAAFTTKDLEVLSAIAAQASVALENSEYARALEHEATQRAQLARFLSPALVEQAARGSIDLAKGGQLTELTILFSDIRGFTSISEKMPAQEVVRMLNDYFELMVDILFEHHGILDKFIGDALMGLWGAPLRRPDDATQAVRAAVKMQKRLLEWNEDRVASGKVPIEIGIGLHTGHVVVGNMGSNKALSYTAIGDGVNLASRLCGIAREGMVVVSQECAQRAGKHNFVMEALPPAKVKNREAPVEIFRVLEARDV